MTQAADTVIADTIVFNLPPAVDAAGAAALISDMIKLPQSNEISLNAAAVSAVSLGYLQILASAIKTFPKLTVSGASAELAEVFAGYGVAFPFGEPPAAAAPPAEVETVSIQAAASEAPSLVPEAVPMGGSAPVESSAPVEALAGAMAPIPGQDAAPAPAAPADGNAAADASAVKTVLTIDDSRTMRDMLRLALSGAGFTVVQAVDGQDGLKVLPQQPIDVIITDINMPKLDGYGVIRAVRSDPAYNETPILVLSTEAEQGSKDIASEAGANGWVVKPFDPDGLIKLINTVCE
jgi:two-component system, chemotaxis family, chemotaxis protein CheY